MSDYISKSEIDKGEPPEFPIGRLLAKNTLFNLTGNILPMIVAVLTIPIIIEAIGIDRFGILTLAWMVIGYFSLFDMGQNSLLTDIVEKYRDFCITCYGHNLLHKHHNFEKHEYLNGQVIEVERLPNLNFRKPKFWKPAELKTGAKVN